MNKIKTFVVEHDIWYNEPWTYVNMLPLFTITELLRNIIFFRLFWFLIKEMVSTEIKDYFPHNPYKQELPYIKFFWLLHSFLSSFDRLIIHTKVGTETPLQVDIKSVAT